MPLPKHIADWLGASTMEGWMRQKGRPERSPQLADSAGYVIDEEDDRRRAPLARLFKSVPFGRPLVGAIQATKEKIGGYPGSWQEAYDSATDQLDRRAGTFETPVTQSLPGRVLNEAANVAQVIPNLFMGPAAQAGYAVARGATNADDPGMVALDAGANLVPGGGMPGIADVGPAAGMTAFHGSPHVFDRFSMDKIGSGEGAQAYGHGLYFTSEPKVAEGYRKELTKPVDPEQHIANAWDRLPKPDEGSIASRIASAFDNDGIRYTRGSRDILEVASRFGTKERLADGNLVYRFDDGSEIVDIGGNGWDIARTGWDVPPDRGPGAFYEVDIADEAAAKFLRYDTPINKQSPVVQEALRKAGIDTDAWNKYQSIKHKRDQLRWEAESSDDADATNTDEYYARYDALDAAEKALFKANPWLADGDLRAVPTGSQIYESFGNGPAAAAALRDAGIPGISYTGDTSGVQNFVTFDDDIVKVNARHPSMAEWMAARKGKP